MVLSGKNIDEEKISVWGIIWFFAKSQKYWLILAQLTALCLPMEQVLLPKFIAAIIKYLTDYKNGNVGILPTLVSHLWYTLLFWICVELLFRVNGWLMSVIVPNLQADIRKYMFSKMHDNDVGFFSKNMIGEISNKISELTSGVSGIIYSSVRLFIPILISAVSAAAMFATIHYKFVIFMSCWVVVHISLSVILMSRAARYSKEHAERRSKLSGFIVDSISNHYITKLFANKYIELMEYDNVQSLERKCQVTKMRYLEKVFLLLSLVSVIVPVTIINYASFTGALNGTIGIDQAIAIFQVTFNIAFLLFYFSYELPNFIEKIGTIAQSILILKERSKIIDVPQAKDLVVTRGEIVFQDVQFGYNGLPFINIPYLKIEAGTKVGIVGYSGSGKSTLLSFLPRTIDINCGRITIDGKDIASVTQESLRKSIVVMSQHPFLFKRTIEKNILYGAPEATRAQIEDAAKQVSAHNLITRLPNGYDYVIGEHGEGISGGQRQRIALARVRLKMNIYKPPILLMDEPTAALDSISEYQVYKSFLERREDVTVVIVAHRLHSLVDCDKIYVMKGGKIIQNGNHQELLQQHGLYAEMWRKQHSKQKRKDQ